MSYGVSYPPMPYDCAVSSNLNYLICFLFFVFCLHMSSFSYINFINKGSTVIC